MTTAGMLRQEGFREGEARARAETLITLLIKRFGPVQQETRESIRQLDTTTLQVALSDILDYSSLEDFERRFRFRR